MKSIKPVKHYEVPKVGFWYIVTFIILFTNRSTFYKHYLITERQVSNYTMPCI